MGGFTGREYTALAGFLVCFSQKDEKGELYLPADWAKQMEMEGTFPKAWKRGPLGWWGLNDLLPILTGWAKQGVPGVSTQMQMQAFTSYISSGVLSPRIL